MSRSSGQGSDPDAGTESARRGLRPEILFTAGLLAVCAGLFAYISSASWGGLNTPDPLGIAFVPVAALATVVLGSAVAWIENARKRVRHGPVDAWQFRATLPPAIMGGIYMVLTYQLGLVLGVLLTLPVFIWLTGYRDHKIITLMTAGFCAFVFLIFGEALDVFLPSALWR